MGFRLEKRCSLPCSAGLSGVGTSVTVYRSKDKPVRKGELCLTLSKGQEGSTEISKLSVSGYIRYLTLV